ncbi:MAG TPA: type VII secretion protein EccE [Amycolatopsis sp.]|nr:type VII secretion protein EccE [Amycolatopsis sp.]
MITADGAVPLAGPAREGTAGGARPRPGGITRFAVCAAALVAIALSFRAGSRLDQIVIMLCAVLLLAATSIRFAGRHLAGWALTWISYRLLRHHGPVLATDPLHALSPDFRLRQHRDRAGNQCGIAGAGDGWSALIRVSGEPPVDTLLTALRAACADTDIPLAGAQLTIRTQGEDRVYLLAARYRPVLAPLPALLRGGGEGGELRATAHAARALMATVAAAGHRCTLLEVGDLAAELRAALGGRTPGPAPAEGWGWWSAGGTTQASFVPLGRADPVSALLARAPGASVTVTSYTLWRTESGKLRDELTIRVVDRLVVKEGTGLAPRARDVRALTGPLIPLYGRQATGIRRTLPLALPR